MLTSRQKSSLSHYALHLGLLGLLTVFLLVPIGYTIRGAFYADPGDRSGFTLDHILLVFQNPTNLRHLVNAFLIATCTTVLCILIALPLSFCAARYRFPLKSAFGALILIPLILPPFVGAIGMQMLLGREGSINTLLGTDFDFLGRARFWGVVVVQALHLYPIVYLNTTAALANLDPALDESAENLGAGPLKRFFRITLPLIRPGLFAGCTIVFIWSFTELGTPLVFDYQEVTPVQIFNGLKQVETTAKPYALTVVMLVAAVAIYLVGKTFFGGRAHEMQSKASRAATEHKLPPALGFTVTGLFTLVTSLALLPHIGVVLTSFADPGSWYRSILPASFTTEHYEDALAHPDAYGAIRNSVMLASAAVILDVFLGLAAAFVIVRTSVKGRALLDALCMLPLAVPGLVLAFGYVAMSLAWPFGRNGPLGGLASVIGENPNPFPILIVAYAVRRLPYIVRAAVAGLEQTSGQLEEAALNLGANRLTTTRRVVVPLIAANLIAGALLAFSFSMLEVSDSLILAQRKDHFPITKAIYDFLGRLGDGPYIASAMGVWGMALLGVTLVGASILIGKRLGQIFRV